LPPLDSFEAVAREWHAKNQPTWAESHHGTRWRSAIPGRILRFADNPVFPASIADARA